MSIAIKKQNNFFILLMLIFLLAGCASVERFAGIECISGDCENGEGVEVYGDMARYIGEFKNSKPDGSGKMIVHGNPQGILIGEFRNGDLYGEGTMTSGCIQLSGTFIGGNIDYGKISIICEMDLNEPFRGKGDTYVGELSVDGGLSGQGTLTYADGTVKQGIWNNSKLVREN